MASVIYYLYRLSPLVSQNQKINFTGWNNLFDFLCKLFTVGVFSQLYFVPMILVFYLLAPYFVFLYKKHKLFIVGILVTTSIFFIVFMNYIEIRSIFYRWTIFPYLIYVVMGFLFADNYKKITKINKKLVLIFACINLSAIIFVYQPYNSHLIEWFGLSRFLYDTLFLFLWVSAALILRLPPMIDKIFSFLSRKSFGIYLYHYLIIDLVFTLLVRGYVNLPLNMGTYIIILISIGVLSSILFWAFTIGTGPLFGYTKLGEGRK